MIVAANILAVSEALVLARVAGCSQARIREALLGGFAGSKVLETHGQRMIDRCFDPGFRIELHQKDLALALDSARAMSVATPATSLTSALLNACAATGSGKLDHSALITIIESMSGILPEVE